MHSYPCDGNGRQRGAALVVAMLVFALCASLVVAMKGEFARVFSRSAGVLLAEQAYAYLRGAEDLAAMALIADYDLDQQTQNPRDDLTEIWAQQAAPYALDEGGRMNGSLQDLQGLFNLNALVPPQNGRQPGQDYTPVQAQFIRLLQALEAPDVSEFEAIAITEAVGDWLDSNNNPLPEGAEDDYYYGLEPAHRAGNRPMASVSELLSVANMTPEIYVAISPLLTVWPESAADLNIHTAPLTVLQSLNADKNLSPLSQDEAQALIEYRDETGFADVDDFLSHQVFVGKKDKMAKTRGLLSQSSSFFMLSAEVELAQRNMRLYSVLERRDRTVVTLVRSSGSL